MDLKRIIVVLSLVFILLVGVLLFPYQVDSNIDNPNPDETFIIPVTPMVQCREGESQYHCSPTSDAMIMRYYDDNFNTNYLGNPYDEELLIFYASEEASELMYNWYGYYSGELQHRIIWWSNHRGCPISEHTPFLDKNNINYTMLKSELNEGRPIKIHTLGHSSVAVGWCEDLEHNGDIYEYPQIIVYDTWSTKPRYAELDGIEEGDTWEILMCSFLDFDIDTSEYSYDNTMSGLESYIPLILLGIILASIGIFVVRRFII